MKKIVFYSCIFCIIVLSISNVKAQISSTYTKTKRVLYFNPEVVPNIEEIKEPTNSAFFSAVSDIVSAHKKNKMLRAEVQMAYEDTDQKTLAEYCENNDADYAIVPKVKYFKVGIGKYVFSNQVVIGLKLFDAKGNLIAISEYDTYKKNMRLLGSAENSIKIGTNGAIKSIIKELKKSKPQSEAGSQP